MGGREGREREIEREYTIISLLNVCVLNDAGAVYIGRYRREQVAVKEFLTQSQAEAFQDEEELPPGGPYTYHEVREKVGERERISVGNS